MLKLLAICCSVAALAAGFFDGGKASAARQLAHHAQLASRAAVCQWQLVYHFFWYTDETGWHLIEYDYWACV